MTTANDPYSTPERVAKEPFRLSLADRIVGGTIFGDGLIRTGVSTDDE